MRRCSERKRPVVQCAWLSFQACVHSLVADYVERTLAAFDAAEAHPQIRPSGLSRRGQADVQPFDPSVQPLQPCLQRNINRTRHVGQRPVGEQRVADPLGVLHVPQEVRVLLHPRNAKGAALQSAQH